jgi:hypothetical protein
VALTTFGPGPLEQFARESENLFVDISTRIAGGA